MFNVHPVSLGVKSFMKIGSWCRNTPRSHDRDFYLFIYLFKRTTTSSIHTEAILVEVTMSMTKNTMVRERKERGG